MIYLDWPGNSGSTDPYWDYVVLLMHGQTMTDSSSYHHTMTAHGSAAVSSTESKFGGSSLFFPNTGGNYISTPGAAEFDIGNQPFTIEAHVRTDTVEPSFGTVMAQWSLSGRLVWVLGQTVSRKVFFYYTPASSGTPVFSAETATGVLPISDWAHLAVTSDSTHLRIFVDGVVQYETAIALDLVNGANQKVTVGGVDYDTNGDWDDGYIDEARITIGVARYTAAFTPPTAAFPDG